MTTSRESAASDTVLTPASRHHDTAGRFWPNAIRHSNLKSGPNLTDTARLSLVYHNVY